MVDTAVRSVFQQTGSGQQFCSAFTAVRIITAGELAGERTCTAFVTETLSFDSKVRPSILVKASTFLAGRAPNLVGLTLERPAARPVMLQPEFGA